MALGSIGDERLAVYSTFIVPLDKVCSRGLAIWAVSSKMANLSTIEAGIVVVSCVCYVDFLTWLEASLLVEVATSPEVSSSSSPPICSSYVHCYLSVVPREGGVRGIILRVLVVLGTLIAPVLPKETVVSKELPSCLE